MLVGVFLTRLPSVRPTSRLPHARGGVSQHWRVNIRQGESSPCSWGCFQSAVHCAYFTGVFPMLVGVFPFYHVLSLLFACLPHARGGVSGRIGTFAAVDSSSPCSWGCFCLSQLLFLIVPVFPMLVGVFLGE